MADLIPVGTVADSFSVDVLGDSRFVPDNAFKVALIPDMKKG